MKKNVIIVGGSKGGVGKSMVSISLLDYYLEHGKELFFIESDTSNPDVARCYSKILDGKLDTPDLDSKDGWMILLNAIEDTGDADVIINTGARNNVAIGKYGEMLNEHAAAGIFHLITLWPINCHRDSVRLLKQYMDTMTASEVFVLKNLYYSPTGDFEVYDGSQIKSRVNEKWGDFEFPDLADRVTKVIMSDRKPLSEAYASMKLGERTEIARWRRECTKIYSQIFGE